jgi:hypothetical protein
MAAELIPLSVLALDLPEPVGGWAHELAGRGAVVVEDDLGRPSVPREVARALFAEHREQQEAVARRRAALEQQAIEKDRQFRAGLPPGVPLSAVPAGVAPGLAMMLSDPFPTERRETMVEHSLANPRGGLVFHPLRHNEDAP